MFVQTRHFSFVIEQCDNETQTDFRATCLLVQSVLDKHPETIHKLDELVTEARRYVTYHEKGCEVDVKYNLLEGMEKS
jgi:hypothetical protein